MHIIKTICNLQQLLHDNDISPVLFRHLYRKIENLQKALEPDTDPEMFSLKNHGPIGLLEKNDQDLSAIGLPASLEEIMPEWVSRLELGKETFHILYVLADNDYCIQVYLPNKILNKTIRKWLATQTVEEEKEIEFDKSKHPF